MFCVSIFGLAALIAVRNVPPVAAAAAAVRRGARRPLAVPLGCVVSRAAGARRRLHGADFRRIERHWPRDCDCTRRRWLSRVRRMCAVPSTLVSSFPLTNRPPPPSPSLPPPPSWLAPHAPQGYRSSADRDSLQAIGNLVHPVEFDVTYVIPQRLPAFFVALACHPRALPVPRTLTPPPRCASPRRPRCTLCAQ